MNVFDPLGDHRTLSIMPTFKCTAACDHCGTMSSPRATGRLTLAQMTSAIDQAVALHYEVVVFTGGEATLVGDDLLGAMARAHAAGLVVRLVTNGHWASSPAAARRRVQQFTAAGLTELNFSTGDQHARFVPLERVLDGLHAALDAGLPASLTIETTRQRVITKEVVLGHPAFERLTLAHPDVAVKLHESPWMPLSPDVRFGYPEELTAHAGNIERFQGCDSVLSTTTLLSDGALAACCGIGMRLIPELRLGHIDEDGLAEATERAHDDLLKRWIKVEGPEHILHWASQHDPSITWEHQYAHRCQACLRLYQDPAVRRVIRDHHLEKVGDVIFAQWLRESFSPTAADGR